MKMVARLPSSSSASSEASTSHSVPIVNIQTIPSADADTIVNNTKKKDVTQMDAKERRAFYLAHFATPEQREKAVEIANKVKARQHDTKLEIESASKGLRTQRR